MAVYKNIYVNPAERLLYFCNTFAQRKPEEPMISAWADVLQIPSADKPSLHYAIALVEQLPSQVVKAVREANPDSYRLYLSWADQIGSAFNSKHMFGKISTIKSLFSQQNLDLIAICSDQLAKNGSPKGFSSRQQEKIHRIYAVVNRYLKKVSSDSDLDPLFKSMLVDQLLVLDQALVCAKVNGSPGNTNAVAQMAGIAIAHRTIVQSNSNSPYIRRVARLAGAYMMAVGFLQHTEWTLDKAAEIAKLPQYISTIVSGEDNKLSDDTSKLP